MKEDNLSSTSRLQHPGQVYSLKGNEMTNPHLLLILVCKRDS